MRIFEFEDKSLTDLLTLKKLDPEQVKAAGVDIEAVERAIKEKYEKALQDQQPTQTQEQEAEKTQEVENSENLELDEDEKRVVKDLEQFEKEAQENMAERSEEHTSELQSRENLVCRLLLEKKKTRRQTFRWTADTPTTSLRRRKRKSVCRTG